MRTTTSRFDLVALSFDPLDHSAMLSANRIAGGFTT